MNGSGQWSSSACFVLQQVSELCLSCCIDIADFIGKIFRHAKVVKNGKSVSVKVWVKVCRCVLLSGSEKDSSPLPQSSCTLILWSFCVSVRVVAGWNGDSAIY